MPLTDILACSGQALGAILGHENPYAIGSWFQAKNIGAIELCKLGELLGLGSYEALKSEFEHVGEPLPDGPWPETIPKVLTGKLTEISDAEIESVCAHWSTIEEFRAAAPASGLAEYLKRLRHFLKTNSGPYFLVNAL